MPRAPSTLLVAGRASAWLAAGVTCLVLASVGSGEVRNSKHDFSATGSGGKWGSANVSEVCVFCHTPHNAVVSVPLWNRNNPTATFKLYESPTLNAVVAQPGQRSLFCLSCHDGSVAIDAFVRGRSGPPQMLAIGDVYYPGSPYGEGGPNIGGNYSGNPNVNDLRNDHPFSFPYDNALVAADGALRDRSIVDLPFYQDRVECLTCHDVHNMTGYQPFLRKSNAQSALCRTCHIK